MDPWDHIRRAVADRRSGSVEIALRAADGIAGLRTRAEVRRATRALVRAHPAMGALWRLGAESLSARDHRTAARSFAERLRAESDAAADALRWVLGRRPATVLTHSSSGSVEAALVRARSRIGAVLCTASLPGGEGRPLARRLVRNGLHAEVLADAAVSLACARADFAVVGADAITEDDVVNKVGTRPLVLACRDAGVAAYAIAASSKLVPAACIDGLEGPLFERTPVAMFDAILTDRGPRRAAAIRRAAARVPVPADIVPRR